MGLCRWERTIEIEEGGGIEYEDGTERRMEKEGRVLWRKKEKD